VSVSDGERVDRGVSWAYPRERYGGVESVLRCGERVERCSVEGCDEPVAVFGVHATPYCDDHQEQSF
jgi:hypothetical protein